MLCREQSNLCSFAGGCKPRAAQGRGATELRVRRGDHGKLKEVLVKNTLVFNFRYGCGSKPMVPFWVGAPPILEPTLVGIGMVTGG